MTVMRKFMDQDFLLSTRTAQKLYHEYAKPLPIVDYHCHLNPQEIYEDRAYSNITEAWLGGDHYKWRQMRSNGVEEKYITGGASPREKFQKWAETLEKAIGNPLYHWSHLELQRYFGYEGCLNGQTAGEVWEQCNARLRTGLTARKMIQMAHVTLICTTDDPADSLKWHEKIAGDESFLVQVLPAWRPDRAMNLEKDDYLEYLERLEQAADMKIDSFTALMKALGKRMEFFAAMGCKASDHGLAYIMHEPATQEELEKIFAKRLKGGDISAKEERQFKTAFLTALGREYCRLGWVMQLHYGVSRDVNEEIFRELGPDAGVDCISNYAPAKEIAACLNALAKTGELPQTILYSLNPADNAMLGTIIGCFQDSGAVGKIQQGSAWWFNDHKEGMIQQMTSLANLGLLGNFIGMLTDSRSFLSYTRHEYFRRILCELIGGWVENGEYPEDMRALEEIIRGICYENAVRYFGFDV